MKYLYQIPKTKQWTVIATFGEANLIKDLDGRLQVIGGNLQDQQAARTWAMTFLWKEPSGVQTNHAREKARFI
jgi:hypothetical protein